MAEDHTSPARRGGEKKPTINDVARLAGVSKKTVSRVINQSPFVKDATRAKVSAIIAEIGFSPDPQARGLALRRTTVHLLPRRAAMSKKLSPEEVFNLAPVMPVVVIDDAAHAVPLARALLAGGIATIEVTLRTPAALGAIRAIADGAPEMIVGAGTVLSLTDLEAAVAAGARYALSPGGTPKLMKGARNAPIPFIPGVATSSEIMRGLDLGYTCFKFFPAEQLGGIAALKAQGGPLLGARFCPTGGISAEKAPAYLALDNVSCVGGSWVAPAESIRARDWAGIEAAAKLAAALRR